METDIADLKSIDIQRLKDDIDMLKHYLFYEGELTGWAKRALEEAKNIPESEWIPHEEVVKEILKK